MIQEIDNELIKSKEFSKELRLKNKGTSSIISLFAPPRELMSLLVILAGVFTLITLGGSSDLEKAH